MQAIGARIAFVVGIGLLIAALVAVWLRHGDITAAWQSLRRPDPMMLALLLCGIFINVLLTGIFFSVLLNRYGNVRIGEMTAVLAAATMLNFLPLQPGLLARLAYHKTINNIRMRDAVKVQFQALSISVLATAAVLLLIVVALALNLGIVWPTIALTGATAAAACVVPAAGHYLTAMTIRLLEVFTWAARYYAAFHLLDLPIDITGATALACIAMTVSLAPLFGNGMGIREWTTGVVSPYLTPNIMPLGLAAELVNRAAEIIVITVCGLVALAWLAQHRRRIRQRKTRP